MAKNTANYGNDSIRQLKDEERVRLRPAVIFGSDGLDGCAHAAFEILSNAVDEARQGYGKLITLTAFRDGSIQVEDNGRGCPLDWNPSEKRFNWELVFCELYAGGKYNNNQGGDYDFSLGTNGLGSCATQYASEYMDVTVWRDGALPRTSESSRFAWSLLSRLRRQLPSLRGARITKRMNGVGYELFTTRRARIGNLRHVRGHDAEQARYPARHAGCLHQIGFRRNLSQVRKERITEYGAMAQDRKSVV